MSAAAPLDVRTSATAPRAVPVTAPEARSSAVSWSAILVGAAAAGSLSLVLVLLGVGFGLSSISPWQGAGASAKVLSSGTIAWISFTQLAASSLGGYLAGRLRVKWAGLHTDEVYFRDTAHGFMAWAVASLVTAAFLTTAVGALVAVGSSSNGSTTQATSIIDTPVDRLLRREPGQIGAPINPAARDETMKIFTTGLREGGLRDDDRQYLSTLVAAQTGVSPGEAGSRIDARFNEARTVVDQARKAAAQSSLWFFVALMLGAFFASLAATYGGRRRDALD